MKIFTAIFGLLMLTFMSGCCCMGKSSCGSCNSCGAGYAPAPIFGGGGCPNGNCGAAPVYGQPVYPPQGLYSPMGTAPTAMTPVLPMTASIPSDPLPTF